MLHNLSSVRKPFSLCFALIGLWYSLTLLSACSPVHIRLSVEMASPKHPTLVPAPKLADSSKSAIPALENTAPLRYESGIKLADVRKILPRCTPLLCLEILGAVDRAAVRFSVDPTLVLHLIRVESYGNPQIVSHKGAIGLMQLLWPTAQEVAESLGEELQSPSQLTEVERNVRYGTAYLRQLLNMFNQDLHAAIAAYNWGPGTISQRIAANEKLPVQYPNKVLKNYF